MAWETPRSSARRYGYQPPPYVSYGVIPLAGATAAALAVGMIGLIDRIPGMHQERMAALPWSELGPYVAATFAVVIVLLVVKAAVWPWASR